MASFDRLVADAVRDAAAFSGWDFSSLMHRVVVEGTPWHYADLVTDRALDVRSLLDLGTGGGEFLAAVTPRPALTVATEGWLPNVPVAAARLHPAGIAVVMTESARDNADQTPTDVLGRLPFGTEAFDLVIDRHEAFLPSEVARVIRPGGRFLTQQVGKDNEIELNEALGGGRPERALDVGELAGRIEAAGLDVQEAREAFPAKTYLDVGVIVFNLSVFPGQIGGFTVEAFRDRLEAVHKRIEADGGFTVHEHRMLFEAVKP